MSEIEQNIKQVEMSIEEAKHNVENRDLVLSLSKHPDFRKLIMRGYFEQEAIRLVHLKGAQGMQSPEQQMLVNNAMLAISNLKQYFDNLVQMGNVSEKALAEHEKTREELLAEDAAA
jgi:hypothetical protein